MGDILTAKWDHNIFKVKAKTRFMETYERKLTQLWDEARNIPGNNYLVRGSVERLHDKARIVYSELCADREHLDPERFEKLELGDRVILSTISHSKNRFERTNIYR